MMNSITRPDFAKWIVRWLSRGGVRGIRVIFRFMPWPVYRMVFPVFQMAAKAVLRRKFAIIRANLRIAGGNEWMEGRCREIACQCLRNFSTGLIELGYVADRPQVLKKTVTIEGQFHLDQALAGGRGVILLGAHFGNFILMYLALVQHGYRVNVIMKPSHDPRMETYLEAYRRQRGIQTIYSLPARQCVVESFNALKRNEVLIILLDQNFGGDGRVFVEFFGQIAATATGPVVFAQRSGAPVLPVFMRSEPRPLCHSLKIGAPLILDGNPQSPDFVKTNIQKMTYVIEEQVRALPHEWAGWMHKRWKSRTREEQTVIDRMKDEGRPVETFYSREV